MLKRQRIILSVLDQAGCPVQRTVLVKLAFLLRTETAVRDEVPFYDFVPYRYGPFSFVLYHELSIMQRRGHVLTTPDGIGLTVRGEEQTWQEEKTRPDPVARGVNYVVNRYAAWPLKKLLRHVYRRYPWYATRSELDELLPASAPRAPCAASVVYTLGYEGTSIDAFLDRILKKGIHVLVDVRAKAVSRKYGFSKSGLKGFANRLRIEYTHVPELGVPSELRRDMNDKASYDHLFRRYRCEILPNHESEVCDLADLFRRKPSALVCMEADPAQCHRGQVALALSERTQFPIVHL